MQKFSVGKFCFIFAILGISYFLMMDVIAAREFNSKLKELPKYVPFFAKYNEYIQENFQYIRTLMATILCSGVAMLMLPSALVCAINIVLLTMMAIVYYSRNFFENPVYYYAPNVFNFIGLIGGFFLLMGEPAFEDNSYNNKSYEKRMKKLRKQENLDKIQQGEQIMEEKEEKIELGNEKNKKQD